MVAVEAKDQLRVLSDHRGVVAADLHHHIAAEQPEGAGDDEQHSRLRPADPAAEKGAQVLQDLEVREQICRSLDLIEASVVEGRAVDDPHDAADRHGLRRGLELPDQARQRARVEHRVGVHGAEQRICRVLDAGVQRVGLARVLLVDHHDPRVGRADVDRPNPGGRDPGARNAVHAHQLERLGQGLESRVGRAVVDRHHLQLQELRAQQRVHRGHDRRRLVVGGHENRDWHAHLRAAHGLVVAHRPALDVVLDGPPAEGGQGRVGQLEHDEVAEDEDVEAADEVLEQVGHAACLSTTA